MDDSIGIVGALAVILLGLALFAALALGRPRAIEAKGYVKAAVPNDTIARLTGTLFELAPAEVHERAEPDGCSWLVFVDVGGSEDSGCVMLVYPIAGADWSAVALVRSGRRIPKIFRQLAGGIFTWAEPASEAEQRGLDGTGWFAYTMPDRGIPSPLKDRLWEAVRMPGTKGLLGIAVIDRHLAIWSDAGRLKTLLATAPVIRQAFLEWA